MSYLRYTSLVTISIVLVTITVNAAPPSPPRGPELHIVFTGVVLYKKVDGTSLAYKVLAPDAPSHDAYVRFSPDDYESSSTLKPLPTRCANPQQQYVLLETEALTVDPPDAVTDQPPLGPATALDRIVNLKDLAGGDDAEFDADYDQPVPKPKKIATQFLIDRGTLLQVVEPSHKPWFWDFSQYSNFLGHYSKKEPCDVRLCGVSGIELTLNLKNGDPISLVSSRDRQRKLVLRSKSGNPISITIGNSRKRDIECKGTIKRKVDQDFEHHYMMLKKVARKCIPFPALEDCSKSAPLPVSVISRGGSDCVGAQWR